jgi:hypothetical protein
MKYRLRRSSAALMILSAWTTHQLTAAPLLSQVQLIADSTAAAAAAPPTQTFTVTSAGSYVVTLTDLQLPAALGALSVAIATPTGPAIVIPTPSSSQTNGNQTGSGQSGTPSTGSVPITQTVMLQAGTYTLQVLATAGQGAVGGTFSVQVAPDGGGSAVFQYEDTVSAASAPPASGQSALSAKFTVASAGTYMLSLNDLAFPVALSSLNVIVLNDCGTTVGCVSAPVSPTPSSGTNQTISLSLAAGTYDLFALAAADSTVLQGLYSVQITGGSPTATLYASTNAVGELPPPVPVTVPAAGSVSLKLTDFAAPQPLASIKGVVAENGSVLQQLAGAGTVSFPATAGTVQVFIVGTPGPVASSSSSSSSSSGGSSTSSSSGSGSSSSSGSSSGGSSATSSGQGSYELVVTEGGQTLADIAQAVLLTGQYAFVFPVTLSAAGSYQVSLNDFQLPAPFSSLSAVIAQAGSTLASTQNGTATFSAAAGPISIVVFPTLSSLSTDGLFGVQLTGPGAGATVIAQTQGVGTLFSAQSIAVPSAGSYDVTLTDLGFPASFGNLAVIVTQGTTTLGELVGGGKLTINASASGTYVLNVLAQVGTGVDYGLYGLQFDTTPPAPPVSLSASASSVTSGGSVTLTWSSSDTTSCIATAMPASTTWAGTLPATSGMQSSGALTANTTFSISCTGNDGTAGTASVSVKVTAVQSGKHGGGSFSGSDILALMLALAWQMSRQQREQWIRFLPKRR